MIPILPSRRLQLALSSLIAAAIASVSVQAAGPAAPPAPPGVGAPFISFPANDVNGQATDLGAALKGKVGLVAFWATWCKPCVDEIPRLRELAIKYLPHGLVVTGIGIPEGGETPAKQRQMAGRQVIPYRLIFDEKKEFQTAYGVRSLPYNILVGADGKIRWEDVVLPSDLESKVQALLDEAGGGGAR